MTFVIVPCGLLSGGVPQPMPGILVLLSPNAVTTVSPPLITTLDTLTFAPYVPSSAPVCPPDPIPAALVPPLA